MPDGAKWFWTAINEIGLFNSLAERNENRYRLPLPIVKEIDLKGLIYCFQTNNRD